MIIISNPHSALRAVAQSAQSGIRRFKAKDSASIKMLAEVDEREVIASCSNGEYSENPTITKATNKTQRPPLFGSDRGRIFISDDFDEPLEDFQE